MAVTLEQFVENLVQSGLFTSDELAAFRQNLPPDRRPRKPQDLARELHKAGRLTKYQAAQVFQNKTKGLVLGDYVIQDEIGAGGMGQVFKAWRRDMERNVALKILPAKAMGSPEAVERFRREVKAAARLEHPNIVTAHDAGEAEGVHFLVMQYIDGKDLAYVLAERGPLPIEEAVDYTIQAARGLECAHEQGVIHRDIKPGNLLLDRKGALKILDMGLARIDQPAGPHSPAVPEALTESGQVMGTYDYMAPEQAKDTHAADHRADIYALGCTLFRLLTDQKPYQGDTPIKTLLAHVQAPIPSLCELREDVPPELDAVVQRMLAKAPAERQQSMGEVIAELEGCIRPSGAPVPQPPTPPPIGTPAAPSSSSDSALKAFLRRLSGATVAAQAKPTLAAEETVQLQREEETSVLAGQKVASAAPRKNSLPWLGIASGLVAAVVILAMSFALLGRGGSEQGSGREIARGEEKEPLEDVRPTTKSSETCLLIQWPEAERRDAKLEIDGAAVNLASSDIESDQDRLKIPTAPGSHRIWIVRRGFAPYEIQVAISDGESLKIKPEWGAAPGLVERAEAEPEPAPSELATQPTMSEPSQVADKPPPNQPEPEVPELDPEEEKRLAAELQYTEALTRAEELIAAWKFGDALTELGKLSFKDKSLASRLTVRREQVEQLARLKSRIIDALNTADPRVTKADLKIHGVGGEIVKADEEGITAKLTTKTETRAWNDLGEQATDPLLGLVIDSQKPQDLLVAGLLAMASKNTSLAEAYFDQARQAGVDIGVYLAPLAATALARAKRLLEAEEFGKAVLALEELKKNYATIPWFASNEKAFDTAFNRAKRGLYEQEAEAIFAEAAALYAKKERFDLRPLVQKLKKEYADSRPVTDAERKPSLAELEKATANLGQFLAVRQDGQGEFTSIQEAIDAASPDSMIEIQDSGIYRERIEIAKAGLAVRGKKGTWPTITSAGATTPFPFLVTVSGDGVTVERVVLHHPVAAGDPNAALSIGAVRFRVRRAVVPNIYVDQRWPLIDNCFVLSVRQDGGWNFTVSNSILLRSTGMRGAMTFDNTLISSGLRLEWIANLSGCTVVGGIKIPRGKLQDCIVLGSVQYAEDMSAEFCDVVGKTPFIDRAKPGEGCINADPQFVDPKNLDYRLRPTSPCIGKASDGGDIGFRYTPEMTEVLQKALELRAQGIIKF